MINKAQNETSGERENERINLGTLKVSDKIKVTATRASLYCVNDNLTYKVTTRVLTITEVTRCDDGDLALVCICKGRTFKMLMLDGEMSSYGKDGWATARYNIDEIEIA